MATRRASFMEALVEKRNVMSAVILRDMRSRFFNHGIGFLFVPLWPLVHMVVLITIYTVLGRKAPFGDSLAVYFATGLLPTLTFMYVSRFMAVSVVQNRSMLAFPVVTILDIMMARAFLEMIGSFLTVAFVFLIFIARGDDPLPLAMDEAVYAYFSILLLAIGVGSIVGTIALAWKGALTVYFILMTCVYVTSGTLFVASNLPDQIAYPLSFSPVLHAVEWMRHAYYETYSDKILDRGYLLGCGAASVFIGLLVERMFRRALLDG